MKPRRKPIIVTRRVLHQIWRRKKCGGTALSICMALDCPYSQILDALHPKLVLSNKLPSANRRPRWSYSAHPSELAAS